MEVDPGAVGSQVLALMEAGFNSFKRTEGTELVCTEVRGSHTRAATVAVEWCEWTDETGLLVFVNARTLWGRPLECLKYEGEDRWLAVTAFPKDELSNRYDLLRPNANVEEHNRVLKEYNEEKFIQIGVRIQT